MNDCKAVLIVEDDVDLRHNLRQVLELEGYEVLEAENGRRALEILGALPPDRLPGCIILDVMMPVMNGVAFAEALVRDHADTWGRIPILVATARGGSNMGIDELPLPVEALPKPVDVDRLLQAVARHCGGPSVELSRS